MHFSVDHALALRFLKMLKPRQVLIAVAYLEGANQCEIAEQWNMSQQNVSLELAAVRKAARAVGATLPKPQREVAAQEEQLSAQGREVLHRLYG